MSNTPPLASGREARRASVSRKTVETAIDVSVDLDGSGRSHSRSGVGFFDHMIDQLARHALIDIELSCDGDRHIDDHHTTEDVGIVLGLALTQALGEKRGIVRYGHAVVPMDEALVDAAIDLSGRPFLAWSVQFERDKVGTFDTELFQEFFRAFAMNSLATVHITQRAGTNAHHVAEAAFKAVARALRMAVQTDPRASDVIPSTKGVL